MCELSYFNTMDEKKVFSPIDLDSSANFNLELEAKKIAIKKSQAETRNKIEHVKNIVVSALAGIAIITLVALTINRDVEKERYVEDLRNDKNIESVEKFRMIKELEDEYHQESISLFYNILIAVSAYFLGTQTSKNK